MKYTLLIPKVQLMTAKHCLSPFYSFLYDVQCDTCVRVTLTVSHIHTAHMVVANIFSV